MNKLKTIITSFILFNLLCLPCLLKAQQAPSIEWQKCIGGEYDDHATCTISTSDGGYAFAGYTSSDDGDVSGNHGAADAWVVKLTSIGTIMWQKCLGGTQNDEAFSIVQTSDHGYAIAGYTNSNDGNVSGNHGNLSDAWVVKLSPETNSVENLSSGEGRFTSVYPNPSEISVKLQILPSQMITHVELYNIMGMPLSPEYKMENNNVTIDVHSLSAGTCIARVTYFDGNHTGVLTLPLVVQH